MGMSLEEYAAKQSEQDRVEAARYAAPAYNPKDWTCYREKLLSQIEVLEDAQKDTKDIEAVRMLSKDILCLAKEVDKLDEKSDGNKPPQIIPEAVNRELEKSMKEAVKRFAERYNKGYF